MIIIAPPFGVGEILIYYIKYRELRKQEKTSFDILEEIVYIRIEFIEVQAMLGYQLICQPDIVWGDKTSVPMPCFDHEKHRTDFTALCSYFI